MSAATSIDDPDRTSLRASGAELRRLRNTAGLTQAALAERASISPRTLRNIESGALTPQRSTLLRIAAALHLAQADVFVALWHLTDDSMRADDDLLPAPVGFDRFLSPAARRARSLQHTVSFADHVRIGPTGLIERHGVTGVLRALGAGLDRTVHVTHEVNPLDWDQLHLTDLHNCHVIASQSLPNGTAKCFEVGLSTVLEAQETHLLSFGVDYARARRPGAPTAPDQKTGVGIRQPGTVLTLQAEFHPDWWPGEIHYQHAARSGSTPLVRRPLRLSRYGIAQITLTDAPTGMHSITWSPPG